MNSPEPRRDADEPCRDAAVLATHCESESARLARLIHDGPAQKLTAAMIELGLWQSDLEQGDAVSRESIQALISLLQSVSSEVRDVTSQLRPRALDLFGLGAAVESLASKHGRCKFRQLTDPITMDSGLAIHLLRVTDVALKSFAASARLELVLEQRDRFVVVQISGGAPGELPPQVAARLRAFGGTMERDDDGLTLRLPNSLA